MDFPLEACFGSQCWFLTLGTLAAVLVAVELLRLWVHRHGNRQNHDERSDPPEPVTRPERRAATGRGARLFLLWLVTGGCSWRAHRSGTDQGRRVTILARADSAYRSGDTKYGGARIRGCARGPTRTNSHATYRLARLRAREPREALRLFRRYVTLEPADPWGYMAVGDVFEDAGKHDEALQWYDEALRLAPRERDAVRRAGARPGAGGTDRRGACRLRALARRQTPVAHKGVA